LRHRPVLPAKDAGTRNAAWQWGQRIVIESLLMVLSPSSEPYVSLWQQMVKNQPIVEVELDLSQQAGY
jgi:hypothetical protein